MKLIPLGRNGKSGKFAKVDDADYDAMSAFTWSCNSCGYAVRTITEEIWGEPGKMQRTVYMHSRIIGTPLGMDTDHINGDKLDNRRSNLRICTRAENLRNAKRPSLGRPRGVHRQDGRWVASVYVNGKAINLGRFPNLSDAVAARKEGEHRYYGEFAWKPAESDTVANLA
jgi:hypothetical protein